MVRSPPTLPFLADDLESHFSILLGKVAGGKRSGVAKAGQAV
jgi:antitoxin (DNA-binding transcriptional repressor) of toxin-antitoxin stability system